MAIRRKRGKPRGPIRRKCQVCGETGYVNPWLVRDGVDASVCSDCQHIVERRP